MHYRLFLLTAESHMELRKQYYKIIIKLSFVCIAQVSLFREGGDSIAGIRTHPPTSWLSRGVWS